MKKALCLVLSITLVLSMVAVSSDKVSAKRVRKGGYYSAVLQQHKPSYGGAYIKKVKVGGNKVTTYGNFTLGKKIWSGKKIKKMKRTFVLSASCKYIDGYGVPGGQRRITKAKAFKNLKQIKMFKNDSPTVCIFLVKGGKVVKLMFGQS